MNQDKLIESLALAIHHENGIALLVGGYVRDRLMKRPSKDVDIEVFGIEPGKLLRILASFGRVDTVGASFGVYKLTAHGITLDVSIPRRDSKADRGHTGFVITGDPSMSYEDAARRRDFTINAISMDPLTGQIIDPFGGESDIERGILRVVDPLRFGDDSLRVLRALQFAARFEFDLHIDTRMLCDATDLSDLPAERVWGEFEKLLRADIPSIGLTLARELGVVHKLWPELAALIGVEQDPEWHPEGDVWTHTLQVVDAARRLLNDTGEAGSAAEDVTVMLAALCHDFGKPATTAMLDGRLRAHGHEAAGVAPTAAFLERLNVHRIDGYDVRGQVLALVADHLKPFALRREGAGNGAFRRLARKVDLLLLARVAEADSAGRGPLPTDEEGIRWFIDKVNSLDLREGPPKSILMGRHLLELGMLPGPEMGEIIAAVFERQMDGTVTNLDEALFAARELMAVNK